MLNLSFWPFDYQGFTMMKSSQKSPVIPTYINQQNGV
nr:MAG TPA: hypothetical protein [Caudoviricetes sp.]